MSDSPSSATTEKTEAEESAIPVTGETSTAVAEVTSTPVIGETTINATEETAIPKTEQATVPTTEMDNDESNKSELDPYQEVPAFNELRQLVDAFDPEMKTWIEKVNATCGVLMFFTQLGALLDVYINVDIDPTGFLVGIYLYMLASLMKSEKVTNVDLARYLIGFAVMLGGILIALHWWCLNSYQDLNCYRTTIICSSPVPLGPSSNTGNYLWLIRRIIIVCLMIVCGIWIVGSNGLLLGVLVFYKPKLKSL